MKITMRKDDDVIECPKGFSFTTLFFGAFVPLYRKDYWFFFTMSYLSLFTSGLSWLVFPFVYNRIYRYFLTRKGYEIS